MGRKIEVEDGESIDRALRRFQVAQAYEYKRWTKKRYGYYEKPSVLKRKRKKMAEIWALRERTCRMLRRPEKYARHGLHLFLGLRELFARSGPTNAAGR